MQKAMDVGSTRAAGDAYEKRLMVNRLTRHGVGECSTASPKEGWLADVVCVSLELSSGFQEAQDFLLSFGEFESPKGPGTA